MDEEISIIDSNTRNERIKNFLIRNKKLLISIITILIIFLLSYFAVNEYSNKKKKEISDLYNTTIIEYSKENKSKTSKILVDLINKKDPTYSPLSLYFIIDNSLFKESQEINKLFDVLIYETSLEKEIKNLIIYKKALFNADSIDENSLLNILNPLINSKSIWKGQALFLMAEYFYSNNEKEKAKEFYNQIIILENTNRDLKVEAQKRLNRDLSE
jgi:predicted negative regulator of RcsB-dependent stress response